MKANEIGPLFDEKTIILLLSIEIEIYIFFFLLIIVFSSFISF